MNVIIRERRLVDLIDDLNQAIDTIKRGTHAGRAYRDHAIETIERTIAYLDELRVSS